MKTLGQVAYEAKWGDCEGFKSERVHATWQAVADAVVQAHEARRWNEWPDGTNNDTAEYPPDETLVDIYCGNWASKDRVIDKISKRCGTYGPSGASHWRALPPPPKEADDARA